MSSEASNEIDQSNRVVVLVGEGMALERENDGAGASAKFREAWDTAGDDYERCIAAHYLPRGIDDVTEKLFWNNEAIRLADAVADDRVSAFYASLYFNVASCQLKLGNQAAASHACQRSEESLAALPPGEYRDNIKAAIREMHLNLSVDGSPRANPTDIARGSCRHRVESDRREHTIAPK